MTVVFGGAQVAAAIRTMCQSASIKFEYFEHPPVRTSEEAAQIRGTPLREGAKALIFQGKKSSIRTMVVVPADQRVDRSKVAERLKEKVFLAAPEDLLSAYGLEVGAVPPFGHILGLRVLIDESIFQNKQVSFNCGLRTASIVMPIESFKKVLQAEPGDWTE